MRRPKNTKALFVGGIGITILLAVFVLVGRRGAESHVRNVMGGVSAPANCLSCHAYMRSGGPLRKIEHEDYLSPREVVVSPDGRWLYVVAEESEELIVVDIGSEAVVQRIPLGRKPHSLALGPDGRTAYVTNSWSDNVSVVDLGSGRVTAELATGSGPAGLAIDPAGEILFVANMFSDDISVIDLTSGRETHRLKAGNGPYAMALSPDGSALYVTNRLTNPGHFREPPEAEITVVDVATRRVAGRRTLHGAHLLEGIDLTPDGRLALTTLVRPKQLVPATQVERGWMLTYGLGVLETVPGGRTLQVLLDDVNAYYADPYDVIVSPDGRRAYVTHAGADVITVVDLETVQSLVDHATADSIALFANHLGLSSRYVVSRIPTGANPKRLALSPDGRRLYVAERLDDRIAVIDTDRLETVGTIDLGGPERINFARLGERTFHAARAFQGQFSCRSCHPDGDQDALAWDFAEPLGLGRNIVNTMTLRDIGATAPFKWAGTNVSLYMQDGIRFAKHLTRVDPFPTEELRALVAYIYSIPQPPNRYQRPGNEWTPAQLRGKAIFERTKTTDGRPIPPNGRCVTCHNGPYFTIGEKFDVGTLRETDKEIPFDTPQLVNIYETAPYLHDGSASTLEEIWTRNSVNDEHGVVSDLTKAQLNDLIQYLRALGPPEDD